MLQKHLMYVKNSDGENLTKFLQNQKENQLIGSLETPKNIGQEVLDDIVWHNRMH